MNRTFVAHSPLGEQLEFRSMEEPSASSLGATGAPAANPSPGPLINF